MNDLAHSVPEECIELFLIVGTDDALEGHGVDGSDVVDVV